MADQDLALAIAAMDAAIANLMVTREAMRRLLPVDDVAPEATPAPEEPAGPGCPHPAGLRRVVDTMGGGPSAVFCGLCGDTVEDADG